MDFEIPGSFPYEAAGARPMVVSPVTREDTCILCGMCAEVCPTAAISVGEAVTTEIKNCIRCCACIKNCPEGARVMPDGMWKDIAKWLHENCSVRKEPQMFGIDLK
jgi:ferredoxin